MGCKAFVFDCDGTLLDSMGMWVDSVEAVLRDFGIEASRADFEETEHLSLKDCCRYFYEKWPVCGSAEAFEQRYHAYLAEQYRTCIEPCRGARELVEAAARAGIPMAIASSTDVALLEIGLERAGLLPFFSGVFSTGDYGTSKAEHRIYDIAREALGADIEPGDTWVFEDAPFGVLSAKRGGYRTVAVRDATRTADELAVLRREADIYVETLEQLSLDMLERIG